MDLASLFGMGRMGMGQSRQAPPAPPLMRFKAGKLTATPIEGTTKFDVKAEHKRGEILLVKSNNELRFQWKDRSTGNVDDDISVYPAKTAEFSRVDTGREEDRVYLLQFKNSDRRLFCWMQEKSDEKDAEICEKIGKYLDGTTPLSTSNRPAEPLLRGDMRTNAATAASNSATGSAGNLSLGDLDAFFQGFGPTGGNTSGTPAPASTTTPAPTSTDSTSTSTPSQRQGFGDWDEQESLRRALEESMRESAASTATTESVAPVSGEGTSNTSSAPEDSSDSSTAGTEESPGESKKEEDKKNE